MRATLWPARSTPLATRSARRLVRVKTSVERSSSASRVSSSGVFSSWAQRKTRCSARSAVVPLRATSTRTGALRWALGELGHLAGDGGREEQRLPLPWAAAAGSW